jgi:hypothetical protein
VSNYGVGRRCHPIRRSLRRVGTAAGPFGSPTLSVPRRLPEPTSQNG